MHQAAVKTKRLSPEMPIIVEAEAFHCVRRQNACCRKGETVSTYRGLRVWHDARWSLYELERTIGFFIELFGRVCGKGLRLQGKSYQPSTFLDSPIIIGVVGGGRS